MNDFFREIKRINWTQTFWGSKKRSVVSLMLGIPAFVGVISFGYQYYLNANPSVAYEYKISGMTQKIEKTVTLPTDEKPDISTVTDTKILPKEQFFAFAENGDKIFIYKKHHLAVLYRPSVGKVITKAILVFAVPTPMPKAVQKPVSAVAGASTSAVSAPVISETANPTPTNHPQGNVLVMPSR